MSNFRKLYRKAGIIYEANFIDEGMINGNRKHSVYFNRQDCKRYRLPSMSQEQFDEFIKDYEEIQE